MWPVDKSDLDRLLVLLAEIEGSDLHIKAGAPPRMRVTGTLRTLDDEPSFTAEETKAIAESIMTPGVLETFHQRHEVDFAYGLSGTGRFRVNAYYQRSSVALAMRRVRANAALVDRRREPVRAGIIEQQERADMRAQGLVGK